MAFLEASPRELARDTHKGAHEVKSLRDLSAAQQRDLNGFSLEVRIRRQGFHPQCLPACAVLGTADRPSRARRVTVKG